MKIIALSVDYDWIDKAETTLKSIYARNQDIKTYIINPDIPHEWFMNINRYLKELNSEVIDLKIDLSRFKDMPNPENRISKMVYGKFLISELIKEYKVLYLDSDVIVDQNLDQLFETNIEDRPLYTVVDYFNPGQFNSGVLLINNRFWYNNNIGNQLLDLGKRYNLSNTQVMMNEGFAQNYGKLNPKYNYQIGYERKSYWNDKDSFYSFFDHIKEPAIIHFTERDKPFNVTNTTELREKWWDYHNLEWTKIIFRNFELNNEHDRTFDGEAYTFTNVAEVQNLEELVKKLPNIHFSIAAFTPVAFLLSHLSQYDNVTIYPSVTAKKQIELINKCTVYLDINYGNKNKMVLDRIVHRKVPILSFSSSQSKKLDYEHYQVFEDDQINEMANRIQKVGKSITQQFVPQLFNIHVRGMDEALDRLINEKKSIIRFGDGELSLINGKGITYQAYDENLSRQLKQILFAGGNNKYDVALPDVFESLKNYGQYTKDFYETNFFFNNQHLLKEIEKTENIYSNTFISRPYIDRIDKSKSAHWFDKLKQIWKDKDILIVEGNFTRSGLGNDLFANTKSIKRIIAPSKNAYQKISEIEQTIRENAEDRLILLMLGPTAKLIVDDLQDLKNQLIDLGHIDSEYEWFKMSATHKVKLKNKHTAEFNFDENIESVHDKTYENEIIGKIE
ncbi:SP_1767 family glycosyltransferase [Lactobacillus taiwanensis]|uniref:Glycosyltransferase n=1 Tax=Lactobacillus taiwanensis TaxID=508451 RepID=A0A256LG52_9LACO|nr:SP_1767 family glycosyltransferase [Lactobacillus taiwanensis]OYR88617.1 glycosyltransferase [Lactobacillus taiwanensis]OYR92424.1 glycosyltransferase [Lactobacillus taiwanensis]OYR95815.1 glycosyltransferase [Lactobacillus taiwanensis]OYR98126.1 glycosyltransferase [Lactobacillus taiwanensis]OYS03947.1 glycosyltransferase [Lactobacillus taiwanensis]